MGLVLSGGRGFRPLPAQRLIYREMWREDKEAGVAVFMSG